METVLTDIGYALPPSNGVLAFVLLTLLVGGGAAWRTGQAVAQVWGAMWPVAAYTALLAAAVRFLHYALFGGTLLSLPSYLVDYSILLVVALIAHRMRRTRHMTEQYRWMFERSGPFTWRDRT
ncbi:MAG: hypothetical protein JNN24_05585 [Hyphomicrobium zavarzinii]|jgi:hypothetical protein|uniref:DUF6867 family protein n=1 Tax=Hyphomicrobium TaxID=81 RepID=UPI00035EBD3B|nr:MULTISPECIES: hypothetical protein [Hyphomicrobium]MBL8845223.1 hypothetical protein [Hyphomicrobium zavarzinii]WBT36547.1 hypothetical protein PE058_12875 [Hyphomicrobium sp. DMF-1]HML44900.1 hypothetical protein [Hyphomicrobium zavarzinii]